MTVTIYYDYGEIKTFRYVTSIERYKNYLIICNGCETIIPIHLIKTISTIIS